MVELNTAVLYFTFILLLNRVITYTKINHWLICWYKTSILDNRSNSLVKKKLVFLNKNLLYYSYFNTTGNPPEVALLLNSTRGYYLHKKHK